jgi:PAS domain S-box-containing protein
MNEKQGSNTGMEQSRILERLRASELKYRRLFESSKDGILILDAKTGTVIDVNPFLMKLLGYSHEVFIGKRVWELGFLKDVIANETNFAILQQKGYVRYENLPLETVDGLRVQVEFVSNVYLVDNYRVIQCNIRDITERKLAEKKIQQQGRDLKEINAELTAFNRAMVGRELRMIELKKEIDKLCRQFGLPTRYGHNSDEETDQLAD